MQFPEPRSLTGLTEFGKSVTDGRGFDAVLDLNGGPYVDASLEAMALKARIIIIGGVAGSKTEIDLYQIFGKRLHVIGTVLRARSLEEKDGTRHRRSPETLCRCSRRERFNQ